MIRWTMSVLIHVIRGSLYQGYEVNKRRSHSPLLEGIRPVKLSTTSWRQAISMKNAKGPTQY